MKTVEEVAWQIIREGLDPDWEAIDMKKITAIIRADREALLSRVEDVLGTEALIRGGTRWVDVQDVVASIAAVKKEVCK